MSASATARSSAADVGPWSASAATCSQMSSTVTSGRRRSAGAIAGWGRPRSSATSSRRASSLCRRRSPFRARRTRACRSPARRATFVTSRVITPVDQPRGVRPGDQVLVERRDVDERRGVADGVVLVLVVRLVRADGVVAGPLAVVRLSQSGRVRGWKAVPIGTREFYAERCAPNTSAKFRCRLWLNGAVA